jgi:hypothetical protein
MKCIETYRWKRLWNGNMSATRHHCTEVEIRKNNPEAVRIEGTLILREIPESADETQPTLRSWPMRGGTLD